MRRVEKPLFYVFIQTYRPEVFYYFF